MAAALMGAGAKASTASDGQSRLLVTATVLKHASLKVLAQPAAVVITAEDIARGHVDVPLHTEFVVNTNTAGYLLDFATSGNFIRQIIVTGLANEVQLGAEGGVIAQGSAPGPKTRRGVLLAFRFVLSESARATTYPWPVRLSAAPM
ncbi:MAG: hypothetical protein NDI84_13235 [Steroidobacteraceae bacterium]|nr:hypothetical protein [Steroidobacteraceae bacterium]